MAVYPTVSVTIVTFNSSRYIAQCLRHVLKQDYPAVDVVVVDNASGDETPAILRTFEERVQVVYNTTNVGFAAGQNQAMSLTKADWLLALNPDVRLTPSFVSSLIAAISDDRIGSVCGKLLTMTPALEIPDPPMLDSTGIFFTPNLRHFDRGSQLPDHGQYEKLEYVFGGTAPLVFTAAACWTISPSVESFSTLIFSLIAKMPTSLGVPNFLAGNACTTRRRSPITCAMYSRKGVLLYPRSSTCIPLRIAG